MNTFIAQYDKTKGEFNITNSDINIPLVFKKIDINTKFDIIKELLKTKDLTPEQTKKIVSLRVSNIEIKIKELYSPI